MKDFILILAIILILTSCSSTMYIKSDTDRDIAILNISGRYTYQYGGYGSAVIRPGHRGWQTIHGYGMDYNSKRISLRIENLPLRTATERAFRKLNNNIPENSVIAIINVASLENPQDGFYVVDLITSLLVNSYRFRVMDRHSLDTIRAEQNFQLSGDVDDNTAVSIGRMVGANIVITGTIRYIPFNVSTFDRGTHQTGTRQLVLKAIDVTTGQIVAMASEI